MAASPTTPPTIPPAIAPTLPIGGEQLCLSPVIAIAEFDTNIEVAVAILNVANWVLKT